MKRLVVKTGEYPDPQTGQAKGEYTKLGVIQSGQNGEYILLDPAVSLAGCLVKQNTLAAEKGQQARKSIMVSIFDDDQSGGRNANAQAAPQSGGYQNNNQVAANQNNNTGNQPAHNGNNGNVGHQSQGNGQANQTNQHPRSYAPAQVVDNAFGDPTDDIPF